MEYGNRQGPDEPAKSDWSSHYLSSSQNENIFFLFSLTVPILKIVLHDLDMKNIFFFFSRAHDLPFEMFSVLILFCNLHCYSIVTL